MKKGWEEEEHSKSKRRETEGITPYLENGESVRAVLGTRAEQAAAGLMPGDKRRLAYLHRAEKMPSYSRFIKHSCLSFLLVFGGINWIS